MENEINATSVDSINVAKNNKSKKPALIACLSALAVALVIVGVLIGRATVSIEVVEKSDENVASQLEFAQADLESAQARIGQLEAELAEATGQEVSEGSLEEQLQNIIKEMGIEDYAVVGLGSLENSPISPFQTITAEYSNNGYTAEMLFWRNGSSGSWHPIMSTRHRPDCHLFGDFMKPLAGVACSNFVSGVNPHTIKTTIGEYNGIL